MPAEDDTTRQALAAELDRDLRKPRLSPFAPASAVPAPPDRVQARPPSDGLAGNRARHRFFSPRAQHLRSQGRRRSARRSGSAAAAARSLLSRRGHGRSLRDFARQGKLPPDASRARTGSGRERRTAVHRRAATASGDDVSSGRAVGCRAYRRDCPDPGGARRVWTISSVSAAADCTSAADVVAGGSGSTAMDGCAPLATAAGARARSIGSRFPCRAKSRRERPCPRRDSSDRPLPQPSRFDAHYGVPALGS